jgi:glycosyltransferase involved in cell wall biosynthesis
MVQTSKHAGPFSKTYEGVRVSVFNSLPREARVLDYGSGSGMMSVYLLHRGFTVTAADISDKCRLTVEAQLTDEERRRFSFIRIDPLADPLRPDVLRESVFDMILCREVLEHVNNPWKVLELFKAHLRPGGILVTSFPNGRLEKLFDLLDPDWLFKSEHRRVFGKRPFVETARKTGFDLLRTYGAGAQWSILWMVLGRMRINHTMGNPTTDRRFPHRMVRFVRTLAKIPGLGPLLDLVVPKSWFFVFQASSREPALPSFAREGKPTVLLVYDYKDWILYEWVRQIEANWSHEFDFVSQSMFSARTNRKLKRQLVAGADVVHLLLPHATETYRDCLDERFIGTIHHWVDFETVEPTTSLVRELVVGSRPWQDRLVEMGVERDRTCVVHSGAPEQFFRPDRREPIRKDALRIGFFAKMNSNESDRKGTRHFTEVVSQCAARGLNERFEFVITGPGWHSFVDAIQKQGARVSYFERVSQEEMAGIWGSLDVYLMLSDVEGGPATIAEAMASRCVVLSTAIGLAVDSITDGVNGYLVENTDYDGIIDRLVALDDDPATVVAVTNAGYDYAFKHLRYSESLAPLAALYARVAEQARGLKTGSLDRKQLEALEAMTFEQAPSAWPE